MMALQDINKSDYRSNEQTQQRTYYHQQNCCCRRRQGMPSVIFIGMFVLVAIVVHAGSVHSSTTQRTLQIRNGLHTGMRSNRFSNNKNPHQFERIIPVTTKIVVQPTSSSSTFLQNWTLCWKHGALRLGDQFINIFLTSMKYSILLEVAMTVMFALLEFTLPDVGRHVFKHLHNGMHWLYKISATPLHFFTITLYNKVESFLWDKSKWYRDNGCNRTIHDVIVVIFEEVVYRFGIHSILCTLRSPLSSSWRIVSSTLFWAMHFHSPLVFNKTADDILSSNDHETRQATSAQSKKSWWKLYWRKNNLQKEQEEVESHQSLLNNGKWKSIRFKTESIMNVCFSTAPLIGSYKLLCPLYDDHGLVGCIGAHMAWNYRPIKYFVVLTQSFKKIGQILINAKQNQE